MQSILCINFILGDRIRKTGKKLWKKLTGKGINKVVTDYREIYEKVIPKKKSIQSKAKTTTLEG